jgi:hypothetical protein
MSTIKLGRMAAIPLRECWPDEARDFTPWLASERGLDLLGDVLGMELELVDTEVAVGSYRADIVATDMASGEKVVIENQLEPTNHDHIGKLITYAATVEASTVIWIAQRIREEHRRALEWLNDQTATGLNFFAIEMQLWKIGSSEAAPRFEIVAQPDNLIRAVRQENAQMTTGALTYLSYWQTFNEYIDENSIQFRKRKPQAQHWYDISIGTSTAWLAMSARLRNADLGCELYIGATNAKAIFYALKKDMAAIESEIGEELEWMDLPNAKASRIIIRTSIDPNDREQWADAYAWYIDISQKFKLAFAERVKTLVKTGVKPEKQQDEN